MGLRLAATLAPGRPHRPKTVPAYGAREMGSLPLPEQLMTQHALGGKEELLKCECPMSNAQCSMAQRPLHGGAHDLFRSGSGWEEPLEGRGALLHQHLPAIGSLDAALA